MQFQRCALPGRGRFKYGVHQRDLVRVVLRDAVFSWHGLYSILLKPVVRFPLARSTGPLVLRSEPALVVRRAFGPLLPPL